MKYRSLFWGLTLIVFGVLWLLKSLSILSFYWCDFYHLWPFLLLWIGVACLPIKSGLKFTINILILLFAVFTLLYAGCKHSSPFNREIYWEYYDDRDDLFEHQNDQGEIFNL